MEADKKISTEVAPKSPDSVSFIDTDGNFTFTYKKTEKLASGVYLVTSLLSDNEPLKWHLRRKAGDFLSFIFSYKDIPSSGMADFSHEVQAKVLELVSLLEISSIGGLISNMNFSILKQEYVSLIDTFNSFSSVPKDTYQPSIPRAFFDVPKNQLSSQIERDTTYAGNPIFPTGESKMSFTGTKSVDSVGAVKDNFKRTTRQNTILSLLRKKKELTIKDISDVIKNCSEKTIQRELISFIEAGVVKRIGERRWSKYSLVSNQ